MKQPKIHIVFYLLGVSLFFCLGACNSEVSNKLEPKGTALGRMNEIVVVSDADLWEGAVGDTFRYFFESAYPILPQPEPLFDIRHFTLEELSEQPLRKELRTYVVLANLSDESSTTTAMVRKDLGEEKVKYGKEDASKFSSVGRDKWARGQLLVYLYAGEDEGIMDAISKSFPAIAKRVRQHDEKQLRSSVYVDRVNLGLSEKVRQSYGIDFQIPGDFVKVPHGLDDEVMWLRKDTDKAIQNIVLQKLPYDSAAQLSKKGIVDLRNAFGQRFISPEDEEDVMVVDSVNLPVYEYAFNLGNSYGKELRGIWEMTNSFSAGPFTTYVILDEKKSELLYIDVFILAPGSTKRDMMMQMDHIIRTAKLVS